MPPAYPDRTARPIKVYSKGPTRADRGLQPAEERISDQAFAHAQPRSPPTQLDLLAAGAQRRQSGRERRSNILRASHYRRGSIHADIRDRAPRTYTLRNWDRGLQRGDY